MSAETDSLASVPPIASFTTRYTPPRTNTAHDVGEKHHAADVPRRGFTDRVLDDAADVVHGRRHIAEYDCGRAPVGDEHQHGTGEHDDLWWRGAVGVWRFDRWGEHMLRRAYAAFVPRRPSSVSVTNLLTAQA